MSRWAVLVLVLVSVVSFGCTNKAEDLSQLTPAERGRKVYLANCMPCHNENPALPGAVAPDIAGASAELLVARVLRGVYPSGYVPKRTSQAMPALPHLQEEIEPLAAYLLAAKSR
jgi:mono/diheme cytochrome c family protein